MSRIAKYLVPVGRDLFINSLVNNRGLPRLLRSRLWNAMGHTVDSTASISPDCHLSGTHGLTLGAHVYINYGCVIDVSAPITVGDHTQIGYGVALITSSHEVGDERQRAGSQTFEPIRIGSGVWVGSRAVILAGVRIGDGCIIGAGSVVTRDCQPNGLYAGIPAARKRDLPVRSAAMASELH